MSQLQITAFGGPEVLQLRPGPDLVPGTGQVLVQSRFAGVNPIDAKTRAGLGWAAEQHKDSLPWTPGYDLSGRVCALGTGVAGLQLEQRVCGMVGFPLQAGAYGDVVLASADDLVPIPEGVTDEQAAGLPLAGLTAWQGLFEHGNLKTGETVLISAAAGGVGHLAVQLAKQAGCRVLASASADNREFLLQLGVDRVLDYHAGELETIRGEPHLVLDLVGGDSGLQALELLQPGGRLVTVPTLTAATIEARGAELGVTVARMLVHPAREQLHRLLVLCDLGQLRVEIAAIFPLAEGAQAHRQIETGHTRGKVLLRSHEHV